MPKRATLVVQDLVVTVEDKKVLQGVSLSIDAREIHAVMGPNGSGKSTLAYTLMGHPAYDVTSKKSSATLKGKDILDLSPEERARAGLYLAFQAPIAIPGVSVLNLLRASFQAICAKPLTKKQRAHPALDRQWRVKDITATQFNKRVRDAAATLGISDHLLQRGIHDGFSGGEKKKIEMLQAVVLKPTIAIFDEIDTGLDVDALQTVADGAKALAGDGTGILVITHYQRILKYLKPDHVHVMVDGAIVDSGDASLAKRIEKEGYKKYIK